MESKTRQKMSDEERLALAEKLDKELDDFIDGLEKKRYTEGWPEDRWQEEMDKHPFFMKKAPEPGDELHPLLQGLQNLKYDTEENQPEELAATYKNDALFYMDHKKYRTVIISCTEGIKQKCKDNNINADLYNIRSRAHFQLENFRSSMLDCEKAIELNPNLEKKRLRIVKCAYYLNKFDICFKNLDTISEGDHLNSDALEWKKKCEKKKMEADRDARKRILAERRKAQEIQNTIDEIKKRNIKFDNKRKNEEITEELLKPKLLPLEDYPVRVDGDGTLTWPAAFSYPEFLISDFYQKLEENVIMKDLINDMFAQPIPCDEQGKYKSNSVNIYYENKIAATVHKVDLKKSIKEILQEKTFYVSGGCLLFYVVPDGSRVEKEFIHEPRKPLVIN